MPPQDAGQLQRVELASAADEQHYLLRSPLEILNTLREMLRKRSLVTLFYGEYGDFILTSVVGVSEDQRTILFDCAPSASLNASVSAAEKLDFVAALDKIKVQFAARAAQLVQFEGSPAFAVATPDVLLRL